MKTNSILLALVTLASTAVAQLPTNNISPSAATLLTDANGNLIAPANFFAANSNLLNASVAPTSGGSQSPLAVNVNGAQKSLTNLAGFQANFATNSTLTVSNQLTGSNATFLSVTSSNGFLGAATSATNFTGALSGDVTGTQSATVVSQVAGSAAANVHAAELLANAATSANTPNAIVRRDGSGNFTGTLNAAGINMGTGSSLFSTSTFNLEFKQAFGIGNDAVLLIMNDNSASSLSGISFGSVGTNALHPHGVIYGESGIPQSVLSVNANGSSNLLYDEFAMSIGQVPVNAMLADVPDFGAIVLNPGNDFGIFQNDIAGNGNVASFMTDYLHHRTFVPLKQFNTNTLTFYQAGFNFATMTDFQNAEFTVLSNLLFGNQFWLGTNKASGLLLADTNGLKGTAFDRATDIRDDNATVHATNFIGTANGVPTFDNGSGTGWGMNSGGSSGVYYFSGSPMLHIDGSSAIRIEQNAPIQPQTGGWSSLGSAALPFGYSFIKTNLLGWTTVSNTATLNDVTLNTLTVSSGACSVITSNLAAAISAVTNRIVDLSKPMTFVAMTTIGQNINFIYCTNWINDTNYQETLFTIVGDGAHSLSFSVPAGENIWTPTNGITTNGVVPASGKIYKLAVSREKIPGLITNTSYALIAPNQ